jgi:hypothetical protein
MRQRLDDRRMHRKHGVEEMRETTGGPRLARDFASTISANESTPAHCAQRILAVGLPLARFPRRNRSTFQNFRCCFRLGRLWSLDAIDVLLLLFEILKPLQFLCNLLRLPAVAGVNHRRPIACAERRWSCLCSCSRLLKAWRLWFPGARRVFARMIAVFPDQPVFAQPGSEAVIRSSRLNDAVAP